MDTFSVLSGPSAGVTFRVASAAGEEALSELFRFTLHLVARRADFEIRDAPLGDAEPIELGLTGQSVSFRIGEHGILRHGIVAEARAEAPEYVAGEPHARIRVEVVPRAWLLTRRRQSRIFQGLYVHQIVSQVLYDSGVNHTWNLANTYPKRLYCTQYEETDYEFVTRLFAEEGILFFFEHVGHFDRALPPTPPAAATSPWSTAATVLGAVGTAGGMVGGMGDNKVTDSIAVGAAAANVAADLVKPPPPDPEADDPLVPGTGSAGWGGAGDVLVFIDRATAYPESHAAGEEEHAHRRAHEEPVLELLLNPESGLRGGEDRVLELCPERRLRAKSLELRDYDFRKPMLQLLATAGPTGAAVGIAGNVTADVYEHHGEYEKPEVNPQLAGVELEQHRADALLFAGRSLSPRIAPGGVFFLRERGGHVPEGRYAVVRVRHASHPLPSGGDGADGQKLIEGCVRAIHEAIQGDARLGREEIGRILRDELGAEAHPYTNRFECVPAAHAFRPARPPPLTRNVTESATVVGPVNTSGSGDSTTEIWTDPYGRVKIQFHWDRDGQYNDASSCWVRVLQTWAGAGFGFQFVPRVGMEVLVTFLRGDPDRPVVLGSLYNATHATPEPLPQRSTRSGIRTQSSPGGGGFNELSFEDAAGVERIYVHAQKDLDETVNDNHTLDVKGNRTVSVAGNQQAGVLGDHLVATGGNLTTLVGANESAQVRGNRTASVVRNETLVVNGNAFRSVDGVAVESVATDRLTTVQGDHNLTVGGSSIVHVGGKDPDVKTSAVAYVQGSAFVTTTDRIVIRAETAAGDGSSSTIRLECGDSFIELHGDKITLSAKQIEILGSETTHLKSKDSEIHLDQDTASIGGKSVSAQSSQGSQLQLDGAHATMNAPGNATVQGAKVALQSSQGASSSTQPDPTAPTNAPNLMLAFFHGKDGSSAIGDTTYRVVVDDRVYEGSTSGGGNLQVWVPPTAKVAFVTLHADVKWPTLYPLGPLVWLVHLIPTLDSAQTPKGARIRLRNLGYEPGTRLDAAQIDDVTQTALLELQLDRDVPPTGLLDDATQKTLTQVYGS